MIVKQAGGSAADAVIVIPSDSDDLFTLRRVIQNGDYVIADTTRLVKQEKEFGRPDRGDRVKVRVKIRVERIELDSTVDRLRIAGTIIDASNELVARGSHHGLTVQAGDAITIEKDRKWANVELQLLKQSGSGLGFVLVAIDTQEAAVARVTGTHLKIIPNIYSGQSGKRYQIKSTNLESFFSEISKTITSVYLEGDSVAIFGPGETRRRFYNYLNTNNAIDANSLKLVEGIDVAGEDGIFVFLRSSAMLEVMGESKIANVSSILDKVMQFVQKNENRYAMGVKDVSTAADLRAIESVVFSDSVFNNADETQVISLLNRIEGQSAKTFAVDSSTDIGLRVSSLGGIVALLRYSLR